MRRLFQITSRRGDPSGRTEPDPDRPPRAFITGATGYIGRAVVRELVRAGYEVAGLTRWAEKTLELGELGARAVVGDVRDTSTFRRVAARYDVLVHLAAERTADKAAADAAALDALLWAARQEDESRGRGAMPRSLIYTSGCFVLGDTGDAGAAEDAPIDDAPAVVAWRPAHERRVLDAADEALATAVIRPGMVYGGHGGLIGAFFETAERDGAALVIGDGTNRWSPVYRGAVARLYRMVADRRARGIFHCAEDRAVPVAELARAASRAAGADGRIRTRPTDEARAARGPIADALVLDQVVRSPAAHALGWRHEHPPFVESADAVYEEWRAGAS